jgi:hypothetical protein
MRVFVTSKRGCGSAYSVGCRVIRVPDPASKVVYVVRQTLAERFQQIKPGAQQGAKKRLLPFVFHMDLPTIISPLWRCGNGVRCWQSGKYRNLIAIFLKLSSNVRTGSA